MLALLYLGIGSGCAAIRLVAERTGDFQYAKQDASWILATSITDILCWPLVLAVLLLRRATAQAHS